MRKNVAVGIIAFLISFVCLLGMVYTPQTIKEYVPNDEDIIMELTTAEVTSTNAVELGEDGSYTITDIDPYIIYDFAIDGVKTIVFKIEPLETNCTVELFVNGGIGYIEDTKYISVVRAGTEYAWFEIEEPNVLGMRIDVNTNIQIKGIELHAGEVTLNEIGYPVDGGQVMLAVVSSVLIGLAAFFLNAHLNFVDKFLSIFINEKKLWIKGIIALAATAVVAIPCEMIIARYILNFFSRGTAFNWNRYIFIICFIYVGVFLFLMKDKIEQQLEVVILGLILIIGSTMVVTQPMAHSGWDVDSHYHFAHDCSYLGEAYITQADQAFFTAAYESLAKPNGSANLGNIRYMNMAHEYVLDSQDTGISLAHLPAGVAMAATRLLGGSFHAIFLSGEFMNLWIYAFLTYFAIKKLKSGKMIMAVFALFPTNLVIATNYSYDYWVTGFTMLGLAYFIGECQERDHCISVKDTIIMCGSFALACVPKQIYVPLMLLPFLMPREKIKNKKVYYGIAIACFIFLFGSLLTRTSSEVSAGGDVRGGGEVSLVDQLYFILANPLAFASTMITHLMSYLSLAYLHQCITNYANLGVTTWGSNIFILVLIYVVVTDKNEYDKYSSTWLIKAYTIAMYLGVAVLVSLSFYLVFTPVGANYIAGCQARYMFPAMIPFLMMVAPHSTRTTMNVKLYRYGVLGIISFIVLMDNFIFTIGRML